jgi:hypothetical protein
MAALLRRDRQRVGLAEVFTAIVELGGGDSGQHEAGTEAARERAQQTRAQRWGERHVGDSRGRQLVAPEARMACFRFGELQEDVTPIRIGLGRSERAVERGAVELIDEVGAKSLDVVRGLHRAAAPAAQD